MTSAMKNSTNPDFRICSLCEETVDRNSPDLVILCTGEGESKTIVRDKAGRVHLLQSKRISKKMAGGQRPMPPLMEKV